MLRREIEMRAFDNSSTNKILSVAGKIKNEEQKILYVFAGPNGSGKSTFIANEYLDGQLNVEYVNADLYCRELFLDIVDENERNVKAMYYCMDRVEKLIKEGKSFCYETVLSHSSKLELVQMAKLAGYKVISTLVYTSSPEINVRRVETRFSQGGHNVPKDKIVARFARSIENAKALEKMSDVFLRFDNSKELQIENLTDLEIENFEGYQKEK